MKKIETKNRCERLVGTGFRRNGVTAFEIMVTISVLTTVAMFVTTMAIQIKFIWRDIEQHQLAINELSNQLDELTRYSVTEVKRRLGEINAGEDTSRRLKGVVIRGELLADEIGNRLVLKLDWNRRYPGKPIELSGWVVERLDDGKDVSDGQLDSTQIEGGDES